MNILIISSGFFPVTDKQGGAVEKLIENFLDYNENNDKKIVLYTVKTSSNKYDRKKYRNTQYRIIDKTKILFKIRRVIYGLLNKVFKKYVPNAYIREVIKDIKIRQEINFYDYIIFENGQNFIPYFKTETQTKSKIILHLHNDYLNRNTKNALEIVNSCNEIWVVSNFLKKQITEVLKTDKIKILYNAIDSSLFNKSLNNKEKMSLRKDLNIKEEFVFLYTGRLMKEKGVKELVIAFNNLNKKYLNVKLLIVGGSKDLTDKDVYISELKKLASSNSNIIFTGYINSNLIYKYYGIASAQVIPSIGNESFGLIALEGVISNLPIIASDTGGLKEVLGESGIYVSKENIIKELEEKMMELVLKTPLELRFLTKDYLQILNKFSLKKYCENFDNYLK